MKKEYKYYEYDPGQAVVYLLSSTIGESEINAVSCFLSPNRNNQDIYSCINGEFKKVINQKPYELPERGNNEDLFVEIKKLSQTPKTVQNIIKPQKTLYDFEKGNDDVIILRFTNVKDKNQDCIYLFINNDLQKSIGTALSKISGAKEKSVISADLVLFYFNLIYPMLKEFVNIEYKKYQYFDEVTTTLENTIKSKTKLLEKIEELRNAQKSGLENEIMAILKEKSGKDGPQIQLSKAAKDYILKYKGDEKALLKAINEAADFVKKMYMLNRNEKLEIDLNYIEINIEKEGHLTGIPEKKRKEKARFYLDKYEEAASQALQFKKKVNIKLIADYTHPKAVQPPAVSANISKYKEEIRYLLQGYPDKWENLRTRFSPVKALANE